MKSEFLYRISRITITILFLIFSTYLWKDANIDMVNAREFENNLKNISLVELSDGINMNNAYPTSDEIGSSNDGYKFKIINNGSNNESFIIKAENNLSEESISFNNIRYQIIKNGEVYIEAETLNDNGILFEDIVSEENTYELKFWISKDAGFEILDKVFSVKIALL